MFQIDLTGKVKLVDDPNTAVNRSDRAENLSQWGCRFFLLHILAEGFIVTA
jgi:hypothetical protein